MRGWIGKEQTVLELGSSPVSLEEKAVVQRSGKQGPKIAI